MPGPVSRGMGDRLQESKLSRYVTSHSGQLSLAVIPLNTCSEYQQKLVHKRAHHTMH